MRIQLFLLSLSAVILEAQHMDHRHHHADTKPDTDLRPNAFFHQTETPGINEYSYYDYDEYEPRTTTTETETLETETETWGNNEELTTIVPWWEDEESTSVTCTGKEWRCLDGHFCLPESGRCDGNIECLDLSDEEFCDTQRFMGRSGSLSLLSSPIWIVAVILLPYL